MLRAEPEKLREQWAREQIEARLMPVEWADGTLVYELMSFPPLATLPSFKDGLFYIQDPSTLLAVAALDPKPGETVLDLCSAPGGKTAFMAERMENKGTVIAHDTAPERLKLVGENCRRLGVTCVTPALPSALHSHHAASFDRILVDAPCSNTGVMRRRVDLRWRIREAEIARLRDTQLKLLRETWPRLKPGGTLVYSTCSLESEENAEVVREFIKENPTMHLQRERSLTPWTDNTDGAYVAQLIKAVS
jgi:16S rRNA (cytosine967-C5)-methyltransferase